MLLCVDSDLFDVPTKCEDFPQKNAIRPDIRLGRVEAVIQRLGRHPADRQTALQVTTSPTINHNI